MKHDQPAVAVADFTQVQRFLVAASCLETGILDFIDKEPATPVQLSKGLSLDLRAVSILLKALAEAGLAETTEDGYRLSRSGKTFIEQNSQRFIPHLLHMVQNWAQLPRIARTGKQAERVKDEKSLKRFMKAMASRKPEIVAAFADEAVRRFGTGRFVDLGGGPGLFCRAMMDRGWTSTLADMPETIDHVAKEFDLENLPGLALWRGDILKDLPPGEHDLVLISNVTHIFSANTNQVLFKRIAAIDSLKGVAIIDFVSGISDTADLFAVNMLVHTDEGDTYSLDEYSHWLQEAGFAPPEVAEVETGTHRILFSRKG